MDTPKKHASISNSSSQQASNSPPSSHLIRQDSEEEAELRLALEEASLEAGVLLPCFSPAALFLQVCEDVIPLGKLAEWVRSTRNLRSNWKKATQGHQLNLPRVTEDLLNEEGSLEIDNDRVVGNSLLKHSSVEERLKKASTVDITTSFCWEKLVSLHSIEHTADSAVEEKVAAGSLQVTVNSGGLIFFALFEHGLDEKGEAKEAAACLKITSSRLLTQSERFGYELAKHLGVPTPQARIIYRGTPEWSGMKEAVEKVRNVATGCKELEEKACNEMLETLDLCRCVLLMGYIHGHPLLETSLTFATQTACEIIAASLGRILLLDLVLRNEDRLVCCELGWRGNARNLLCTIEEPIEHVVWKRMKESRRYPGNKVTSKICEQNRVSLEKRSQSAINFSPLLRTKCSGLDDKIHSIAMDGSSFPHFDLPCQQEQKMNEKSSLFLVAIDSGVSRRPPTGKRKNDVLVYPKFVELLINDSKRASEILSEISGGRLGSMQNDRLKGDSNDWIQGLDQSRIVRSFQTSFRHALRDMQQLQMLLLNLHRKLDHSIKQFVIDIGDSMVVTQEQSPLRSTPCKALSPLSTPKVTTPEANYAEKDTVKHPQHEVESPCENLEDELSNPSIGNTKEQTSEKKKSPSPNTNITRRLTLKFKDVSKIAKIDPDLNRFLQQWDEALRKECRGICELEGFVTGFLECDGSHSFVDGYELKVRLEHILERMALISQGSNTEKPSCVSESLYIGGVQAAKSTHTLLRLGITHVLCLCPADFKLLEEPQEEIFQYLNLEIKDTEDECVSAYFEDACNFIADAVRLGGKVLVHCFEGKSRSPTLVLAYLMKQGGKTLLDAWTHLKAVHQRSKPNDGFMRSLMKLDKELHGNTSMEWKQKKPVSRICPLCEKAAGISNETLQYHLRQKHSASAEIM